MELSNSSKFGWCCCARADFGAVRFGVTGSSCASCSIPFRAPLAPLTLTHDVIVSHQRDRICCLFFLWLFLFWFFFFFYLFVFFVDFGVAEEEADEEEAAEETGAGAGASRIETTSLTG